MRIQLFLPVIIALSVGNARSQENAIPRSATGLTLSLPWINNVTFYDYKLQHSVSRTGFMGIGGAFYYRHKQQKFSLNLGSTRIQPTPVTFVVSAKKDTAAARNIRGFTIELLYHRPILQRINFIGGINAVRHQQRYNNVMVNNKNYGRMRDRTTGVTLGAEYLFPRNFAIALLYRPSLFSLGQKEYRHLLSLDARFDFENPWKWRNPLKWKRK